MKNKSPGEKDCFRWRILIRPGFFQITQESDTTDPRSRTSCKEKSSLQFLAPDRHVLAMYCHVLPCIYLYLYTWTLTNTFYSAILFTIEQKAESTPDFQNLKKNFIKISRGQRRPVILSGRIFTFRVIYCVEALIRHNQRAALRRRQGEKQKLLLMELKIWFYQLKNFMFIIDQL